MVAMEHAQERPAKVEELPTTLGDESPTDNTHTDEIANAVHDNVKEESLVMSVKREHAEVDASVADESSSMAEDIGAVATPVEIIPVKREPMAEDTLVAQGSENGNGEDKLGSEESDLPVPEYLEGVDVSVVDAEQLLAYRCVGGKYRPWVSGLEGKPGKNVPTCEPPPTHTHPPTHPPTRPHPHAPTQTHSTPPTHPHHTHPHIHIHSSTHTHPPTYPHPHHTHPHIRIHSSTHPPPHPPTHTHTSTSTALLTAMTTPPLRM